MKTTDFNSTITSTKLAENIEKQFGVNVVLDKYNREQLEDFRNKLRTKIFQQEGSAKVNELLTNETYQKNKAMLELLNTRIKEMLGEQMKKLLDKIDTLTEAKKKGHKPEWLEKAEVNAELKAGQKVSKAERKKVGLKQEAKEEKCDECGNWMSECSCGTMKEGKKGGKCCCKTEGKKHCPIHGDMMDESKAEKCCCKTKGKKHCPVHGDMMDESKVKKCANGHTKMTKNCDECSGFWESKDPKALSKAAKHVKKGALHKQLHIPQGKKIGDKKLKSLKAHGTPLEKKRATFALNIQGKNESFDNYKHNVKFINESLIYLLLEDEEGKAKTITAAGDIVKDFTSWMQRVGQYQTKAMIELADAIRADFGAQEAETFKQSVAPALSATLETLTSQREAISNAVAVLAGEATTEPPMGMDASAPVEPGMEVAKPDEMNPMPAGDEFAASDAAAGAGTSGREMRESREERRARRLAEENNIIAKLAK